MSAEVALARLPPPHRVPAGVARDYLREAFALPPIALTPGGYAALLDTAVTEGIAGGAVYDALVGVTAREAGATLLTLDRRAVPPTRGSASGTSSSAETRTESRSLTGVRRS